MKQIKIGRKHYQIKDGDYILYNGACYKFCSGDGRILKQKSFDSYRCLRISRACQKAIPFDKMGKETFKRFGGVELIRWTFKNQNQ